jgi:hypothetical protein
MTCPVNADRDRFLVCSFPPEYCEFGSHFTRCKEWLLAKYPKLYEKYYSEGAKFFSPDQPNRELTRSEDALQEKLGTLSIEGQKKLEQDTAKKEAKAEAKADAELKKKKVAFLSVLLPRPFSDLTDSP